METITLVPGVDKGRDSDNSVTVYRVLPPRRAPAGTRVRQQACTLYSTAGPEMSRLAVADDRGGVRGGDGTDSKNGSGSYRGGLR